MTHCKFCCSKCKSESDGPHKSCGDAVVPLSEADVTKVREKFLPKAIDGLQKQIHSIEHSEALADALTGRQEQFDNNIATVRAEIEKAFAALHEAISQREKDIIVQLEEISSKSKYGEYSGMTLTLPNASALIEGNDDDDDDDNLVSVVDKVEMINDAASNIDKTRNDMIKHAINKQSVDISFEKMDELTKMLNEFGKVTHNDGTSADVNFNFTEFGKNAVKLSWNRHTGDGTSDTPCEVTYIVDVKKMDEDFTPAYSGTECECIIPDIEPGTNYAFKLSAKVGEVKGTLDTIYKKASSRFMTSSGLIHCDLCVKNALYDRFNANQCPECRDAQLKYAFSIKKSCPLGHPLLVQMYGILKNSYPRTKCGICRNDLYGCGAPGPDVYVAACFECLYFVCPACLPKIAPLSECKSLVNVDDRGDIHPLGIQKVYRDIGFIYCGRQMNQCRCGGCDGRCGPDDGCPCEECLEDMRRLLVNANVRCNCGGGRVFNIVTTASRKGFFKTTCKVCNKGIQTDWYKGLQLMLSCPDCKQDICPKCLKSRLKFTEFPENVYVYWPELGLRYDPDEEELNRPCV